MLKLQKEWPGTVVKVEPTFEKHNIVIGGAHIVWPWARATMKRLAKTVFCDATFHVTIYNYKVVMFTTLDGNHQHRPLMVSFIVDSTTVQWQRIFDIFYRYVFVWHVMFMILILCACDSVMGEDSPDELFVIQTDKEKAISAGLQQSSMKDVALHLCCSLHAKWSTSSSSRHPNVIRTSPYPQYILTSSACHVIHTSC